MPFTIDQHFGIHRDALLLRAHRAGVLAANLANADTPNYKARDIDFKAAMTMAAERRADTAPVKLLRTHSGHQDAGAARLPALELSYRVPSQTSLDGNTVEADTERGEFTENALGYLVSLRFLNGRAKSLLSAIKGE